MLIAVLWYRLAPGAVGSFTSSAAFGDVGALLGCLFPSQVFLTVSPAPVSAWSCDAAGYQLPQPQCWVSSVRLPAAACQQGSQMCLLRTFCLTHAVKIFTLFILSECVYLSR